MLNRTILMGRITATPELRHTPGDVAVTAFSIAVERNYGKSGEKETDFFDIVAWRNTAEFVTKYFKKGQLAAVEGVLQTRSYEKDGIKRKIVEVIADNVYFAGGKQGNNTDSPEPPPYPEDE